MQWAELVLEDYGSCLYGNTKADIWDHYVQLHPFLVLDVIILLLNYFRIQTDSSIFEIEEGYGIFDVSPLSGQLFLTTPLDYETQSEYNVTVSARNIAGAVKSYKYELQVITCRPADSSPDQ